MRSLLDALSAVSRGDGAAVRIMIRPAFEKWTDSSSKRAEEIRNKGSKSKSSAVAGAADLMGALWKPPTYGVNENGEGNRQLTALEQEEVEAIESKVKYPGYEVWFGLLFLRRLRQKAKRYCRELFLRFHFLIL